MDLIISTLLIRKSQFSQNAFNPSPQKISLMQGSPFLFVWSRGSYAGIHGSGFRDFLLKSELLHSITDCGFEHPSEVQHECIPQALLGMDVLCQAKSGMGKTAIFVLATLHQLDVVEGEVSVLVLCHTRELAFQIAREYERFSKYLTTAKVEVIYGGLLFFLVFSPCLSHSLTFFFLFISLISRCSYHPTSNTVAKSNYNPQHSCWNPWSCFGSCEWRSAQARQNQTLCAWWMRQNAWKAWWVFDKLKGTLVFRQRFIFFADMRRDVQEIFKRTPHDKQVMMFSATLPGDMRVVSKKFMQNVIFLFFFPSTFFFFFL